MAYICITCKSEKVPPGEMRFTFQSSAVLCARHLTSVHWEETEVKKPVIKKPEPRLSKR